ncbi:MAG: hypothetical protein KIG25_02790 [Eubacteriales bacterium]|nr:hypothetical protein [Eubacteriales bacterium]
MKHYVLYQAEGHNYVIECKDLEDAIKQREKHIKEEERTTKIADEKTLKDSMKKQNLKLIIINEEM